MGDKFTDLKVVPFERPSKKIEVSDDMLELAMELRRIADQIEEGKTHNFAYVHVYGDDVDDIPVIKRSYVIEQSGFTLGGALAALSARLTSYLNQ